MGFLVGSLGGMFVLSGVPAAMATAATVVYHAIALWVPAMWGTVAFLILRHTRDRPLTPRPPRLQRSGLVTDDVRPRIGDHGVETVTDDR
jgi:hypothetical protein